MDTVEVARRIIGCVLSNSTAEGVASGMIIEAEAYLGQEDQASHARFGMTDRSRVMFGPPGRAYVYLVYGMHHMFNVVTGPEGKAGAVLIRACRPMEGIELMKKRRTSDDQGSLMRGPGRTCQALGIDLDLNGSDLCSGPLGIWQGESFEDFRITATPRIGVVGWRELPYRFHLSGDPMVSALKGGS